MKFNKINVEKMPKHFDSVNKEKEWTKFWEENSIYAYDPKEMHKDTFIVDTPPPTVSGSLHIGHVSVIHIPILSQDIIE